MTNNMVVRQLVLAGIIACQLVMAGSAIVRGAEIPADIRAQARTVTAEPHRVLMAFGIGESELHFFQDNQTDQPDNEGTLLRLLFRVPEFSLNQLHQWQSWSANWNDIRQHAASFRGAIVQVDGIVRDVTVKQVPEMWKDRYPFTHYYRVDLETLDNSGKISLYCRRIPLPWQAVLKSGGKLREHVRASAMFLHLGKSSDDNSVSYVLVADRLAWLPDGHTSSISVEPDLVWLAGLGVDADRLSQLVDRTRMGADDREVFYQVLRGMGDTAAAEIERHASSGAKVSQLLSTEGNRGEVFTIKGRARRAVKVAVDDPGIRKRFGLDHYYEVEMFVESDVLVKFAQPADGNEQGKTFDAYPMVFCLRELPPTMPLGETIHQSVVATGAYFKQWAYRTEYMSQGTEGQLDALQFSPLLIGRTLQVVPTSDNARRYGGWLGAAMFVGVALLVGGLFWQFKREDRKGDALRRRRGGMTGGIQH